MTIPLRNTERAHETLSTLASFSLERERNPRTFLTLNETGDLNIVHISKLGLFLARLFRLEKYRCLYDTSIRNQLKKAIVTHLNRIDYSFIINTIDVSIRKNALNALQFLQKRWSCEEASLALLQNRLTSLPPPMPSKSLAKSNSDTLEEPFQTIHNHNVKAQNWLAQKLKQTPLSASNLTSVLPTEKRIAFLQKGGFFVTRTVKEKANQGSFSFAIQLAEEKDGVQYVALSIIYNQTTLIKKMSLFELNHIMSIEELIRQVSRSQIDYQDLLQTS